MIRPPRIPFLGGPRKRPINAGLPSPAADPTDAGRRRLWPLVIGGLLLAAAVAGILVSTGLFGDEDASIPTVAPLPVQTAETQGAEDPTIAAARLGFPTFATKNTTRIGGASPVENAAAAALATFPSSGESEGPNAVALVPSESWPVALAAAVLTAPPISAPLLITDANGIGEFSEVALRALSPTGRGAANGNRIFAIGAVNAPKGFEAHSVRGNSAAAIAAELAELRRQLTGDRPDAFVLISDSAPAFAMPAASWAARSGDPILITHADRIPAPTRAFLAENPRIPVYLLGPENVISKQVERRLGRDRRAVTRIEGPDPVLNAIEFARFGDGSFGWNITDPGHGLVITSDSEPLNAVAAAPLAAAGTWAPLLLTNDSEVVPGSLRSYLLDIKPGYSEDPTRALYNHIWLIGDQAAITVSQQATLDRLAELERIDTGAADQPGSGADANRAADGSRSGDNPVEDANDEEATEP